MDGDTNDKVHPLNDADINEVTYNPDKDFYKGVGGELRLKAEGLFKKAREKGISIEEVNIATLKDNQVEFPGVGIVELPTFIVKVKGRHNLSGQVMVDGKQIDYYNRYQKYVSERIETKNVIRDDKGRIVRENGRPKIRHDTELFLTEWERFDIGKRLIEDKEFGMEKTITGACDRVIRKLMGENDWLYPEEARLLDEEISSVQKKITGEQEQKKHFQLNTPKRATERQINYLKARIKNLGLNPDDSGVLNEVLKQSGFFESVFDLSTNDMSKIIDNLNQVVAKVKSDITKKKPEPLIKESEGIKMNADIKQ